MMNDNKRLQVEEKRAELAEIIEEMDIPDFRRNVNKLANVRWLFRNLLIRNRNHPRAAKALVISRQIMRGENGKSL